MNPINWKSISAPSIDINSKSENKVDEKIKVLILIEKIQRWKAIQVLVN